MESKIITCGCNGAGKSTLGQALAERMGYIFKDIEDYYYFEKDDSGVYIYKTSRTKDKVSGLLLKDFQKYK